LVISSQTAPFSLVAVASNPAGARPRERRRSEANALLAEQNTSIMRPIRIPGDQQYRLWLGFADMAHFGKKFQNDVRCLAAGLQKFASALERQEAGISAWPRPGFRALIWFGFLQRS
jgi:hypothetical protein